MASYTKHYVLKSYHGFSTYASEVKILWKHSPTDEEKIFIQQLAPHLNISNWYVVAKTANTMTLRHKRYRRIYKNLQLEEETV
ncbi:DUF6906 family protein [Lysinibacillus piscis]|uniref:DUF6906 family protein n=1 Tax=Lysinibacillus piscis TaxID=2518931 RepID=UPI0035A22A6D